MNERPPEERVVAEFLRRNWAILDFSNPAKFKTPSTDEILDVIKKETKSVEPKEIVIIDAETCAKKLYRAVETALIGYRVLKTMLEKAGLDLGVAVAVEHIAEFEALLKEARGDKS